MISNEKSTFEESPLTNRPGIVVGYRDNGKPIYNVAGGSIDVDVLMTTPTETTIQTMTPTMMTTEDRVDSSY
jgi:hypothetical protein